MPRHQLPLRRTRRRVPLVLVATLLAVASLGACGDSGGDEVGSASGPAQAPAEDVLRVGSDLTYPPYAYLKDDEPAGFDPEFVRALAAQIDRKPTFQDTRFEQLIPNLTSGRFDVIASALYITAERAEQVDYIPYLTTGNSIVARADAAERIAAVSDLCGKSVGVIKGAAVAKSLREEANGACKGSQPIDVRDFPTDPEATQVLLSGQVDAQVTDAAVAKVAVDRTSGKLEITSRELLYPIPVGFAVKKGSDELASEIRRGLEELRASGKYPALLDKYNLKPPDEAEVAEILGT